MALLAARRDLRWRGLEGSVDCLPALARTLSGGAVVDLETLQRLPRHIDAVLAADTLEHLSDPCRMLRLIHAALPAGAPLLLSVPNIANVYVRANLLVGRFPYADRGLLDRTHRVFFTRALLRRWLAETGFRIERSTVSTIPIRLVLERRLPGAALAAAELSLGAVTRALPTLFGYQLLVVARRL